MLVYTYKNVDYKLEFFEFDINVSKYLQDPQTLNPSSQKPQHKYFTQTAEQRI